MYKFTKLLRGKQALLKKLLEGEVLCLQTGRLYGLLADATNESALRKVYVIKNRAVDAALPIFCCNMEQAKLYAEFNADATKLAERLWPSDDLTMVLPKIPHIVGDVVQSEGADSNERGVVAVHTAGQRAGYVINCVGHTATNDVPEVNNMDTMQYSCGVRHLAKSFFHHLNDIALRIPSNAQVRWLIEKLGRPVSGTSANVSHEQVVKNYAQLDEQLLKRGLRPGECTIYGSYELNKDIAGDGIIGAGFVGNTIGNTDDQLPSTIIAFCPSRKKIRDGIECEESAFTICRKGAMAYEQITEVLLSK